MIIDLAIIKCAVAMPKKLSFTYCTGLNVIKLVFPYFRIPYKWKYGRLNVCKIEYGNMDNKYGTMEK